MIMIISIDNINNSDINNNDIDNIINNQLGMD